MTPREIRRAVPEDLARIAGILWRAPREDAAPCHDAARRADRLPGRPAREAIAARLSDRTVWVCEEAGRVTGVVALRPDGSVDVAHVVPGQRGSGTADALLAMVENHAAARGLRRPRVRGSDMARPVLAGDGWPSAAPAPRSRDGIETPAAGMARDPSAGPARTAR